MNDKEFERRVLYIVNNYHGRGECCAECGWFDRYSQKCCIGFDREEIPAPEREVCDRYSPGKW